jgi:predicted ArsR family transcriptional regulator
LAVTYTVKDVARMLGVSDRAIRAHLAKVGAAKHGPAWLIDDATLERLRASVVGKPGRPWHKERGE